MAGRREGPDGPAATGGDDGPPTRAVDVGELWDEQDPVADRGGRGGRHVAGPGDVAPPAAPPRPKLRHRVLPRSLLGLTALILSFAVGAGFSGVVLYSYYQFHLNQTNSRVNNLIDGYRRTFSAAQGDLAAAAAADGREINQQLGPLRQLESDPAAVALLTKNVGPSVFFVHTLDQNGQPSVGSAFVISSSATQSLLLTSDTTVAAAQRNPAPPVYVRQGSTDTRVTVRSFDPQYDLALIVLPRGNLPVLTVAPSSPAPTDGNRVYAVSGLGSAGASLTAGSLVDVSSTGLAEDAAVGQAFQGGPLINTAGQVIAVASLTYAPEGFTSQGVWYAPYVQAACSRLLSCPGGSLAGSQ